MRYALIAALSAVVWQTPALAHGWSAHMISNAGQPPEVVAREPDPHLLMAPFKVFLVDDGTCPAGQIKRFTRGSSHYHVAPVRECISR